MNRDQHCCYPKTASATLEEEALPLVLIFNILVVVGIYAIKNGLPFDIGIL
jgi:hypothetical protein